MLYEIAGADVVISLHFPSMKPILTFCAAFLNSLERHTKYILFRGQNPGNPENLAFSNGQHCFNLC